MAFDIKFVGDEFEDEGVRLRWVMLSLGSFEESMHADMTDWSVSDYEQHWLSELTKVIGPTAKGALIVTARSEGGTSRQHLAYVARAG